jgi:hypothetical protein
MMTTTHHTAIATGAPATAATVNNPLGQLDAALISLAAQSQAALDAALLAGAAVTAANGPASQGQKVVTVDSTTGFVAGCSVEYALVGGALEINVVDTVDSTTQLTFTTNIGTGGIANNAILAIVPAGMLSVTGSRVGATAQMQAFTYGVAIGDGAVADKAGQLAMTSGKFAANKDAQSCIYTLRNTTTGAETKTLLLNGTDHLLVPTDTAWSYIVQVTGISADVAKYHTAFSQGIVMNANGTVTEDTITDAPGTGTFSGCQVLYAADNVNKALKIYVIGEAGETIRWVATVYTTEVTFAS